MEKIVSDAVPLDMANVHDPVENKDILTKPTLAEKETNVDEEALMKEKDLEDNQEDSNKDIKKAFEENESESVSISETVITIVDPISDNDAPNINHNFEESFDENGPKPRQTNKGNKGEVINQILINNPVGVVQLGPTVNINVDNTYTQVNNSNDVVQDCTGLSRGDLRADIPSKDFMRPLWYSNRLVEEEDLMRLSKNIGTEWKAVGNGLKFNWAQLEQFEKDTRSVSEAVHRMLFRWIQWKDSKATVGRLTKVLFNHGEYDAIKCLSP